MKIRNPNYANTKLSTRDGVFEGDALGTFDLPDETASALLATPGWKSTRSAAIAPPVDPAAAGGTKKGTKGPGAATGKAEKASKTAETTETTSDASTGADGASTGSDEGSDDNTKTGA